MQKRVSDIFFVFQNTLYQRFVPDFLARCGQIPFVFKNFFDSAHAVSVKKQRVDQSYNFSFFGDDLRFAVRTFFVTEQIFVLELHLALTIGFFLTPTNVFTY